MTELPPPPKDILETPGNPPSEEHKWIPGHWQWNGKEYVWIPGHWAVK